MDNFKYDVFISYSRKDTSMADRICRALDDAGITYFIDRRGIGGGNEFPNVLAHAILESRLFLYLASKNSYESKYTDREISFAFNEKDNDTMLPYIIDGSRLPDAQRFIFSNVNFRNSKEHPIDVIVNDILRLLGRPPFSRSGGDNPPPSKKNSHVLKGIIRWCAAHGKQFAAVAVVVDRRSGVVS